MRRIISFTCRNTWKIKERERAKEEHHRPIIPCIRPFVIIIEQNYQLTVDFCCCVFFLFLLSLFIFRLYKIWNRKSISLRQTHLVCCLWARTIWDWYEILKFTTATLYLITPRSRASLLALIWLLLFDVVMLLASDRNWTSFFHIRKCYVLLLHTYAASTVRHFKPKSSLNICVNTRCTKHLISR